MNKKIISILSISIIALLLGGFLLVNKADATVPGDFLYGIDRAYERLQEVLTFSQEGKAEIALDRLDERMSELEELESRENVDPEVLDEAFDNLSKQLDTAKERVRSMEQKDNPDMGSLERVMSRFEKQIKEHYQNVEELQEKIQNKGEDKELSNMQQTMENYKREVNNFKETPGQEDGSPGNSGERGNGSSDNGGQKGNSDEMKGI
jgi:hypothetical protein